MVLKVSNLTVSQILKNICKELSAAIDSDFITIFLLEDDTLTTMGDKMFSDRFGVIKCADQSVDQCLCGRAISEKKPIYSIDIKNDTRCTEKNCTLVDIQSFAALPLIAGNEILGVLAFGSSQEYNYSRQASYLESLANQIAISLQNALLLKKAREHAAQLEQQIVEINTVKAKIKSSKLILQTAFDGIAEPLIFMDQAMIVKMMNKPAADYYQVDFKSPIGLPCYLGLRGRSTPCDACKIQAAIAEGKHKIFASRGIMDPERFEEITVYPAKDDDAQTCGAIVRISDITEAKLLQKKLAQSEKLSALGLLVSGIAHEINNPNNFITFNVPVLREHLQELMPLTDAYAAENEGLEMLTLPYDQFRQNIFDLLDFIEHGSTRIKTTVGQLRGFVGNREESYARSIDLHALLDRVLQLCRPELKNAEDLIEIDVAEELPQIVTDPNTLEQVLVNLLINASHALDTKENWIGVQISLNQPNPTDITIAVSDNGCGMDAKTQAKIFDPFFSTKPPGVGTGLGLYICYNLIEEVGGRIEVQSEPGKGSTFQVILAGAIITDKI